MQSASFGLITIPQCPLNRRYTRFPKVYRKQPNDIQQKNFATHILDYQESKYESEVVISVDDSKGWWWSVEVGDDC